MTQKKSCVYIPRILSKRIKAVFEHEYNENPTYSIYVRQGKEGEAGEVCVWANGKSELYAVLHRLMTGEIRAKQTGDYSFFDEMDGLTKE